MKMRIGIMGGTFNPIHNGHLQMASQAYREFHLDKVLVMPSGDPPHKRNQTVLDAVDRCAMVKLAISNIEGLEFSDIEVQRQGYSYTAETLQQIHDDFAEIFFIIGADSLFQFEKWYLPQTIMNLCTLVVANRNQHENTELLAQVHSLEKKYNSSIKVLHIADIPISSSEIRANVQHRLSITNMVPQAVEDYIMQHELYK